MTIRPVIAPGTYNNAGTTPWVGAIIDRLGYDSLTYAIATGTLSDADATYTVLLEESNDSGMSGATVVADADLIGTEAAAGFTFADDGETRKLGYVGNARYTRLTVTPAAANSGDSPLAAMAILGRPHSAPVT
ncbi:hypothetical protein N1F91_16790 [Aquibium sp. ELW1220]|nr:hypothetical protein [Aquibium sp. ELW1220]MDN2581649.1 hypothetical protein [Aquibium sp. ELW1220]